MAQKQPPYVGGVATVAANGTVVTVTGALDDTNCIEGDHIRDPATGYESRVLERLTVQTFRVPPWRGAALAGAAYELYPDSNLRGGYQAAVTTQLLARLSSKGLVWTLPAEFASPTAAKWGADDGQYVFSPSLKLWWIMQAGAWTPTGAPYGMMATNALSEIFNLGLAGTALLNLGGSTIGRAVFTAIDNVSALAAVGGSAVGRAVFTAVGASEALIALGFNNIGRFIATAADAPAVRSLLLLGDLAVKSISEVFAFTNVTDSTSSTSGAVTTSGGLGVAKAINAGGMITSANALRSTANPRVTPQIQVKDNSFSVANNDVVAITPATFWGLMVISVSSTGDTAIIATAFETAKLLNSATGTFAQTSTAGKCSVFYATGVGFALENKTGNTINFKVGLFQTL